MEDVSVAPGRYVAAVSGGVDSMVLLELLHGRPGVELTVAHYEHGIRGDSSDADRVFVEAAAARYGLPFVYEHGRLGALAGEALARQRRYDFLERARVAASASAVLTAHHQDDVLETAIINVLRGTGRRGLTALRSRLGVQRPLLDYTKADITAFAAARGLTWREDETNTDEAYLRNYIRRRIVPRLGPDGRRQLLAVIARQQTLNDEIEPLLASVLAGGQRGENPCTVSRLWFIMLPHAAAREVLAAWLRRCGCSDFDRRRIEDLTAAAKTLAPGKQADIGRHFVLRIGRQSLTIAQRALENTGRRV